MYINAVLHSQYVLTSIGIKMQSVHTTRVDGFTARVHGPSTPVHNFSSLHLRNRGWPFTFSHCLARPLFRRFRHSSPPQYPRSTVLAMCLISLRFPMLNMQTRDTDTRPLLYAFRYKIVTNCLRLFLVLLIKISSKQPKNYLLLTFLVPASSDEGLW